MKRRFQTSLYVGLFMNNKQIDGFTYKYWIRHRAKLRINIGCEVFIQCLTNSLYPKLKSRKTFEHESRTYDKLVDLL